MIELVRCLPRVWMDRALPALTVEKAYVRRDDAVALNEAASSGETVEIGANGQSLGEAVVVTWPKTVPLGETSELVGPYHFKVIKLSTVDHQP